MQKESFENLQYAGDNLLMLHYIPLRVALLLEDNPKLHDDPGIKKSIREYGFQDPGKWSETLNGFIFGNGRVACLSEMFRDGDPIPDGIALITDGEYSGEWAIPVIFGNDIPNVAKAKAFVIDHNNLTLVPGIQNAMTISRVYDRQKYAAMLDQIKSEKRDLITVKLEDVAKLSAAYNQNAARISWSEFANQGGEEKEKKHEGEVKFSFGDYSIYLPMDVYQKFVSSIMRLGSIEDVLKFGCEEIEEVELN